MHPYKLFPPFSRDNEFISAVFSRSGVIYLIISGKHASLSQDLEMMVNQENVNRCSHVSGGYYYLHACQRHPSVSMASE